MCLADYIWAHLPLGRPESQSQAHLLAAQRAAAVWARCCLVHLWGREVSLMAVCLCFSSKLTSREAWVFLPAPAWSTLEGCLDLWLCDAVNSVVVKSLSRVRLCDPTGCSPPGSSVHGILQARTLEWVAVSSSRGPSGTKDRTCVFCTAGGFFTNWTTVRISSMALFSREGANVSWMWCEIFITRFEAVPQTDAEVGTSAKIVLLRGHAGQRPTSWFLESFYLDMYVSSLH